MMPRMRKPAFVFDTVSLANFLLADAAKVLVLRYSGRAFITEQVFDELTSGMRLRPRLKDIENLIGRKHFGLIAMTTSERALYSNLINNLGKGEASCIAAGSARGLTIVTDDRAARSHCAEAGLKVTGTVGILKAACLDKQLQPSEADRILREMIDNGFYSPAGRISDLL
jgi:predicted nucleic acid-binding protein